MGMNGRSYFELVSVLDGADAVRILVTSDIHTSGIGNVDATGASVIVLAGDVMGAGMHEDSAGWKFLEDEFFPWCKEQVDNGKEIVLTAGNHDKFLYRCWERGTAIRWPKGVHYLIDSSVTVAGLRFWGTPWCTKDRDGRFECGSQELAEHFGKIPLGVDVLVAHTPPLVIGETIDVFRGGHDGSAELTDAILAKKPRYCICGHVHGGSRETIKVGETTVMNVARVKGDRSEEAVKPKVIQISVI